MGCVLWQATPRRPATHTRATPPRPRPQLGWDKEERIEGEEGNELVHPDYAKLESRSLFEQLKEQRDKKDADADARFKLNFGARMRARAHAPAVAPRL